MRIIKVNDDRTLKKFLKLPSNLYRENPYWVPPLISDLKKDLSPQNPFFKHAEAVFFLAEGANEKTGRIAAIVDRNYIEFHREDVGFFGLFECSNNAIVARGLLDSARSWLREKGLKGMIGPINLSTNDECGILIDGFDLPPCLMMPYNPSYYTSLLEGYGLRKAKDLLAYTVDIPEEIPEKIKRVAERLIKSDIRVRPINMKEFDREVMLFKELYNSAWESNWGFVPMTDEEIGWTAKRMKPLIIPNLALFAEVEGRPVGLMLILPDYNQVLKHLNGHIGITGVFKFLFYSRKIDTLRLMILGVKKEYRNYGIDALLYLKSFEGMKNKRYKRVELSWVLEDNIAVHRIAHHFGAKVYKRYRIYEMDI